MFQIVRDEGETGHFCPSQPDLSGRTVDHEVEQFDIAPRAARIAVTDVTTDFLLAHAAEIGFGDEAGTQAVRRQPVEDVRREPGPLSASAQDLAHGIGMQSRTADPARGLDLAKQGTDPAPGHIQPGLQRPDRAGFGPLPAGEADHRPSPVWSVLLDRMRSCRPCAIGVTSSTCKPTSSERRRPPAKPTSSSARSRRPRGDRSQVASRSTSRVRRTATGLRTGRCCVRSTPCSGPWMARWPAFQGQSPNRWTLPMAARRRRMVFGEKPCSPVWFQPLNGMPQPFGLLL
ncbi:hypothetical protein SXCC_00027 [Gluconacetobacter sp. SXCC-1]|nr:hypothetical protein SXCC_00027 [Gluconacetobacter sp. SXCC-1]